MSVGTMLPIKLDDPSKLYPTTFIRRLRSAWPDPKAKAAPATTPDLETFGETRVRAWERRLERMARPVLPTTDAKENLERIMREERGRVSGDAVIAEPYTLWGTVMGDLKVLDGGKVYVRGNVGGDLIVDHGGRVHVYGHIAGNLMLFRGSKVILSGVVAGTASNDNGRLFVDKSGRVLGKTKTKGKYAETRVEDDYGIKIERGK